MIIISDAHVSEENQNVDEFFEMLACLETLSEDLVFLGDIFDLWIGLPRYTDPIHYDFLAWCRRVRQRQTIGFIEGNHEFFVTYSFADSFSWSSRKRYFRNDLKVLFVHGDLINRADTKYLLLRLLTKNILTRTLCKIIPGGKKFAFFLKEKLKTPKSSYQKTLPHQALRKYADQNLGAGLKRIITGHFHHQFDYQAAENRSLHVLPAWLHDHRVSRLDTATLTLQHLPWRELSG